MGAAASSEESHDHIGFHVVQVQPDSPGALAGLVSFFDFIVAANGIALSQEDDTFKNILAQNVDKPVKLLVFNSREEKTRETIITPTNKWGGQGLVGISIRFCNFSSVNEHVWRILDVYPRSPAVDADLQARTDYIVGTPDQQFTDAEDFFAYVEANMRKPIRLYVYSSITDKVRLVTITPNDQWGGHGCLGCDVGFGYLHRIPKKPVSQPSDGVPGFVAGQQRRLHPLMVPTANGFATPPPTDTSGGLEAVEPAQLPPSTTVDSTPPAQPSQPQQQPQQQPPITQSPAQQPQQPQPQPQQQPEQQQPQQQPRPIHLQSPPSPVNVTPPPTALPPTGDTNVYAKPKPVEQAYTPPTAFVPLGAPALSTTAPQQTTPSTPPSQPAQAAPAPQFASSSFQAMPPGASQEFERISL